MSTPNNERSLSLPQRPLLQSSLGPRRVQLSNQEQSGREHGEIHRPRTPMEKQERLSVSRKRSSPGIGLETPEEIKKGESRQDVRSSIHSLSSDKSLQRRQSRSTKILDGRRLSSLPKNLQDTIVVNGKTYIKLKMIGEGGSSKVYRVINECNEVLALKCVKLSSEPDNHNSDYLNEVSLLQSLRGTPGIIDLIDSELNEPENILYILMECGETDLKSYLARMKDSQEELDMNFIRLVWQQMLTAVNAIHQRHIIHSDLKPGNFLFVKGQLKLIDFGIAKSIAPEATSVLREGAMGTLAYISPEALMETSLGEGKKGVRIHRSADVWSLGCILYQMVYKQSPWNGLSLRQKVAAIVRESFEIPFPTISNPWLLDVVKSCLQRDPMKRPPIEGPNGLLEHPFLQPQGQRAMQLYKQMSMDNEIMREVIRQIHATGRDERWKREGMVPLFTKELVIQRARNRPIDVIAALNSAEKKLGGWIVC